MKHGMWMVVAAGFLAVPAMGGEMKGELSVAPAIRSIDIAAKSESEKQVNAKQLALVGRPVLVSLILKGKVIRQREMTIERYNTWVFTFRELPMGEYSVRFEGEGMQTLVKQGYIVSATSSPIATADLLAGTGVRVVTFGTGMDVMEQMKARIQALERTVAELKKRK